jgi:hypothetical protein
MVLKWTSKAFSGLARLYEFLAAVNKPAAVHTVTGAGGCALGLAGQSAHR